MGVGSFAIVIIHTKIFSQTMIIKSNQTSLMLQNEHARIVALETFACTVWKQRRLVTDSNLPYSAIYAHATQVNPLSQQKQYTAYGV